MGCIGPVGSRSDHHTGRIAMSSMSSRNAGRWAAGRRFGLAGLTLATAVVLEFGIAGAPSVAVASSLDYRGPSQGPSVAFKPSSVLFRDSYASSSERPIRRRRPGAYYSEGGRGPTYFANLGLGSFDPSSQPGRGVYFNNAGGSEVKGADGPGPLLPLDVPSHRRPH